MHTTASDGRCTPRELVDRVVAAGITVMAVTDHDTTAAVADVQSFATTRGVVGVCARFARSRLILQWASDDYSL